MNVKYGPILKSEEKVDVFTKIDIEKVAERLGGKVSDPPPQFRNLVPHRSFEEARDFWFEKRLEELGILKDKVKIEEAFELYDHMKEKQREQFSVTPIYGCQMPMDIESKYGIPMDIEPKQNGDIIDVVFSSAHNLISFVERQIRKVVG